MIKIFFGILEVTDENSRIRIRAIMSRIRNTGFSEYVSKFVH